MHPCIRIYCTVVLQLYYHIRHIPARCAEHSAQYGRCTSDVASDRTRVCMCRNGKRVPCILRPVGRWALPRIGDEGWPLSFPSANMRMVDRIWQRQRDRLPASCLKSLPPTTCSALPTATLSSYRSHPTADAMTRPVLHGDCSLVAPPPILGMSATSKNRAPAKLKLIIATPRTLAVTAAR